MLNKSKSNPIKDIPDLDPGRAIYVDFEGTKLDPPSLLGVFYVDTKHHEDRFVQYVIEPLLRPAGEAKSQCVNQSLEATLEDIVALSRSEEREIVAWSSREELAVEQHSAAEGLNKYFSEHLVDGKVITKQWKKNFFPNVQFSYVVGYGRHRLAEYMKLIGYSVPSIHGPWNTGQRIRHIRHQLIKRRGDYDALTPVTKAKWTNMLEHNRHDCVGLSELFIRMVSDLRELSATAKM